MKLYEGITHIDDLEISKFMDLARRMQNKDASIELSTKWDGSANLGFGVDEEGNLYFDRAVKGQAERRRSPNDWPKKPMFNAIRSAVAAMLTKKKEIESLMQPGEWTDSEIMFETIPNSIEYGDNMIIVHDVKYNKLVKALRAAKAKIDLYFFNPKTGKIGKQTQEVRYVFGGKEVIPTKKYQLSINADIDRLEEFLSEPNDVFKNMSNFEVLGTRSVGKDKDRIAKEKARLAKEIKTQQLSIKDKLIDQILNKIPASKVAPPPVFDDQGNNVSGSWPEGIVIKDLDSGDLTKVVSVFPEINKFLWHYREMAMRGAGPAGKFVPGIMQVFKDDIGDKAFGVKQLKVAGVASYIRKKYPGQPANEKLLFFLRDKKFKFNRANQTKSLFLKAVKKALTDLNSLRREFETVGKKQTLKVQKGTFQRVVQYSPVQIRKTYETFITVEDELKAMLKKVQNATAKTPEGLAVQLLRIYFGRDNMKKMNEDYDSIINRVRNIIKERYLTEAAKRTKIGIILGRFQPPQKMHIELIERALKENDRVYVFVAGQGTDKRNPIPHQLRANVLEKFVNDKRVQIYAAKSGFLPALIDSHADLNNVGLINAYCGTDRKPKFLDMFKYFDHDDIKIKINVLKRDPDSVSSTKVRDAIGNSDYELFKSLMPVKLSNKDAMSLFKKYQRFIKPIKNEAYIRKLARSILERTFSK